MAMRYVYWVKSRMIAQGSAHGLSLGENSGTGTIPDLTPFVRFRLPILRSFTSIAVDAGGDKILKFVAATVSYRLSVVDLKCDIWRATAAVLANKVVSGEYGPTDRRRQGGAGTPPLRLGRLAVASQLTKQGILATL